MIDKQKKLKTLLIISSCVAIVGIIICFVGVGINNTVTQFSGFGIFLAFAIVDVAIAFPYGKLLREKEQRERDEFFQQKGISPAIIVDNKDYFFFVDKEKGIWGTEIGGEIYECSDIISYRKLFTTTSPNSNTFDKIAVRIFLKGQRMPVVIKAAFTRAQYGSGEYKQKIGYVDKIINALDEMTKRQLTDFLDKNEIKATETFIYDGYIFGYDIAKKVFFARTEYGPMEKHSFSELVTYDMIRDGRATTKLDFSDALIGALIAGGVGAAIWGKSSIEYCSELSLHIVLVVGDMDYILSQREPLPSNSPELKLKEIFVGNVVRSLKLIERANGNS